MPADIKYKELLSSLSPRDISVVKGRVEWLIQNRGLKPQTMVLHSGILYSPIEVALRINSLAGVQYLVETNFFKHLSIPKKKDVLRAAIACSFWEKDKATFDMFVDTIGPDDLLNCLCEEKSYHSLHASSGNDSESLRQGCLRSLLIYICERIYPSEILSIEKVVLLLKLILFARNDGDGIGTDIDDDICTIECLVGIYVKMSKMEITVALYPLFIDIMSNIGFIRHLEVLNKPEIGAYMVGLLDEKSQRAVLTNLDKVEDLDEMKDTLTAMGLM